MQNENSTLDNNRGQALQSWVIYRQETADKVDYLARRFNGVLPTSATIVAPDINTLRQTLADAGFTPFARELSDPPNIVETWL